MNIVSPPPLPPKAFTDPAAAVDYVAEIYNRNTGFIREHLYNLAKGIVPPGKVRAVYPQAQVTSQSYGKTDSTLPYGYLHTP
ncbi:MAG: AMP nucleosidase, partial [Devosia sp.]